MADNSDPAGRFTGTVTMEIREVEPGVAATTVGGRPGGDRLTDNNYADDGYRFHDVFHLALAANTGWSPTLRYIMQLPRKNPGQGGKNAGTLDEGIVSLIFSHVRSLNFLQGGETVEPWIIESLQGMTRRMDVPHGTAQDWEKAITEGTRAWLDIRDNRGGAVTADFDLHTMRVEPRTGEEPGPGWENVRERLQEEMEQARQKAIHAMASYNFLVFGYWADHWANLHRAGGFNQPNPFREIVDNIRMMRDQEKDAGPDLKAVTPKN